MTAHGAPPPLRRLTAKVASPNPKRPLAGGGTISPAATVGGDVLVENIAADVATERGVAAAVQIGSASPCACAGNSAEAHTRALRSRHMTLNHLYDVDGDRATGRATTVVSIATASG